MRLRGIAIAVTAFAAALAASGASAADTSDYDAKIEARAKGVEAGLKVADPAAAARVHQAIVDQYHALKSWHEANDARLKAARKGPPGAVDALRASLLELHTHFLGLLAADLSPDQVDQVKDRMTFGKVQFTFKAYTTYLPTLTDEQKARILSMLKDAREEAMDAANTDEKSAVFKRAKGRINNYLSSQGLDVARAEREMNRNAEPKSSS